MPELPRPRDAADDAQREASLAAFEAIIGQSSMGFFLADPGLRRAINDYLKHERAYVAEAGRELSEAAPFRKAADEAS